MLAAIHNRPKIAVDVTILVANPEAKKIATAATRCGNSALIVASSSVWRQQMRRRKFITVLRRGKIIQAESDSVAKANGSA
jgi:uncharacterized protein YaeQ